MFVLRRIGYSELNGRQKENYNYSKLSAVLADYGFVTTRLTDDWQGADILAHHIDGVTVVKVQLKSRMTFAKKYMGKEIFIAFPWLGRHWYFYPHDEVLKSVPSVEVSDSWEKYGGFSYPKLSKEMLELLEPYKVVGDAAPPTNPTD